MRRRKLLQAVLLALAGASTSVAEERQRSPGQMPEGARPAAPSAPSQPLAEAERETLLAFAAVLVGSQPLSPPERGEILSYIADRGRASGDTLALYRETAALLDRLAGAAFSTLAMGERLDLVVRHRLVPSRGRVEPPDEVAHAVRTRVAPDLIAGYYGSSLGWALVGYRVFPGRCGDLVRYTRPEP